MSKEKTTATAPNNADLLCTDVDDMEGANKI